MQNNQIHDPIILKTIFEEIYDAVARETLPFFRQNMDVDNKLKSGFDPVTEADRAAERAIRAIIEQHFPDDGILGEEYGLVRAEASTRWVIDPIDGTRAFICGLPVWGSLTGLIVDGKAIAGMMAQPFTKELYFAHQEGAFLQREGQTNKLTTSTCTQIDTARAFTTSPHLYNTEIRTRFEKLESQVQLMRYGCDCYAFAMLAAGSCDLVIEPGLQTYDIVGLITLIEQAGGVVTTFDGARPENGGNIIAAATPQLHAATLKLLG